MPWDLKRFQQSGQSHFVTFCCFHRRPSLGPASTKQAFEAALERVRRSFGLCVFGYVVMPEHVHLLISEPRRDTLANAIKSLKQGVARRFIGNAEHFWQKRYYDFNVRNRRQFVEKLRYIHRNPVKRGLCEQPEDWQWSSFVHHQTGSEGAVEIESEWTANKRERAAGKLSPLAEMPHSSVLCLSGILSPSQDHLQRREYPGLPSLRCQEPEAALKSLTVVMRTTYSQLKVGVVNHSILIK